MRNGTAASTPIIGAAAGSDSAIAMTRSNKTPNRLIHEKSPYLLQHAYNPVDWYPWGEEAFAAARRENRPIFLSIGYSTCYWCHVMEREVFEDTAIAGLMNRELICIKVDREERPDIDRIYMSAVQAISGSGGWPMSLFLTQDLKPFFGATYIPPAAKYGRPGFPEIVRRIAELWKNDRAQILESSEQVAALLSAAPRDSAPLPAPDATILEAGFRQFQRLYDPGFGGFGGGPKFPRPAGLDFLFRYYARTRSDTALEMALTTLRAMARGGMRDHLAGGFHRYAVDREWRVPHFEKMLYDQAQLAVSYLEAYQITREEAYAAAARTVFGYVLTVMRDSAGGFSSAEDAESARDMLHPEEKEEGAFYLWTRAEITAALGDRDGEIFSYAYGVEDTGNVRHDPMNVFAGRNILFAAHDAAETADKFGLAEPDAAALLTRLREKLLKEQAARPRPMLDDKVIAAWNGMMISAFARGYEVLDDRRFLDAAEGSARFALRHLIEPRTHAVTRRYRSGEAKFEGGLEDYAYLAAGFIDLYEASFDGRWLEAARALTEKQIELFADDRDGGFFETPADAPALIVRMKEEYDGAEPSGNSIAAINLLRLSQLCDRPEWRDRAESTVGAFIHRLRESPEAMPKMLIALDWMLSSSTEIVIAGRTGDSMARRMLDAVRRRFLPHRVLLLSDGASASLPEFARAMGMIDGKPAAYVCENFTCRLPATELSDLEKLLDEKAAK